MPTWRLASSMLIAIALFAAACGTGGDADDLAAPTPEQEATVLLPPTPRDDQPVLADDQTEPTAPAAAADATAAIVEPSPTPTTLPLNCLTPRQQYAQLLLPLATQSELAGARDLAAAGDLGGLGLLGQPDGGLAALLADLQASSFVPILVASDEEGGLVQRLATLLGPLPSAADAATTNTPDEVQAAWLEYGSRVKDLGIDVVFGPVLDVGGAPGIGSRSFGEDPAQVTAYGRAVADGLTQAGIMPVFKHFPGHGRASGDSHLGLPLTPSLDELRTRDLVPYVDIVGGNQRDDAAVMIAHLSVPGLSGDLPTSLSPETVNGLLKREIGFDGIVFTDAMNMGAIVDNYGTLDALERAFNAGVDIAILGSLADVAPVLDHLLAVAEADPGFAALLDNRVRRVLDAKGEAAICLGAQ